MDQKPPYIVPGMEQIEQTPWNGYRVVSSFSGCGGTCLGFRMAGFRASWASEFIEAARDVYLLNHPGVYVNPQDIRSVTGEQILKEAGLEPGQVDVFEGSPPCASFSTAGKRDKKWGEVSTYSETEQRVDDLFFEYARLLGELQPRVFVAENVSGLVKGKAKGYFKEILKALSAQGYIVKAKLLNAMWLGVPQSRERLIFMGVRKDLGVTPRFPEPLRYFYSVAEALPWIVKVKEGGGPDNWRLSDEVCPTVVQSGAERGETAYFNGGTFVQARVVHDTKGHPGFSRGDVTDKPCPAITVGVGGSNTHHFMVEVTEVDKDAHIDGYAIEEEWEKLRPGTPSDKFFNLRKIDQQRPSPTVLQTGGMPGAATVTLDTQKRKFYIGELKRIMGFPDDFQLTGTYKQQWERLGRAVPPVMAYWIGRAVRDTLFEIDKREEAWEHDPPQLEITRRYRPEHWTQSR